eukprot:2304125-Rhodomonas_salina.1
MWFWHLERAFPSPWPFDVVPPVSSKLRFGLPLIVGVSAVHRQCFTLFDALAGRVLSARLCHCSTCFSFVAHCTGFLADNQTGGMMEESCVRFPNLLHSIFQSHCGVLINCVFAQPHL